MATFYTDNNELDFKLNGFGEQKVFREAEAVYHQLLLLLFFKPGDYPSLPKMGVNISKQIRYKRLDYLVGNSLKELIMQQIREYLTQIDVEELNIWSSVYKGEYYVILDFILSAEKTISIAMTRKSSSNFIDVKVEFN